MENQHTEHSSEGVVRVINDKESPTKIIIAIPRKMNTRKLNIHAQVKNI